jgi:hypothetical protein
MSTPLKQCNDNRPCFGKGRNLAGDVVCRVLCETYADGECPFCKPESDVTKGKKYPYKGALEYAKALE